MREPCLVQNLDMRRDEIGREIFEFLVNIQRFYVLWREGRQLFEPPEHEQRPLKIGVFVLGVGAPGLGAQAHGLPKTLEPSLPQDCVVDVDVIDGTVTVLVQLSNNVVVMAHDQA